MFPVEASKNECNEITDGEIDSYTSLASKYYGVDYADVTPQQRHNVKSMAYRYVYSK